MRKIILLALALAGVSAVQASTINESFTGNPSQSGWKIFGDTNLFRWDSTNHNLAVTWDSAKTNSYFYHPLGTILARDDDFSLGFDLRLNDFIAGVDPTMPSPFQLSIGFLNLAEASQSGFLRGTGYNAQDLAEFCFFPDPGGKWTYGPSLTGVMIDSTGFNYANGGYDPDGLTTNDVYHVNLAYTASNSNLVMTLTRNNVLFVSNCVAHLGASFTDFRMDAISISSYSQAGQDTNDYGGIIYAGSILAHGTVDNLIVNLPPPPAQYIAATINRTSAQMQINSRINWNYALERTADFQSWTNVPPIVSGTGNPITLQDGAPLQEKQFYRVKAWRSN